MSAEKRTPYDDAIAEYEAGYKASGPKAKAADDRYHLLVLRSKAEGYRQGQADYSALLEAAKAVYFEATGRDQRADSKSHISGETFGRLEAAIAAAEGRAV